MREDYLLPDDENLSPTEREVEKALRPLAFQDFAGQEKILEFHLAAPLLWVMGNSRRPARMVQKPGGFSGRGTRPV